MRSEREMDDKTSMIQSHHLRSASTTNYPNNPPHSQTSAKTFINGTWDSLRICKWLGDDIQTKTSRQTRTSATRFTNPFDIFKVNDFRQLKKRKSSLHPNTGNAVMEV
ncbi:hypothetical protein CDAR_114781 [Caerostris darwini]|uniref:Uncharacterized protein n=1 Tax=Caerostris darwini TaxID=1538125 RepID=A0AAV4MFU7_9ARAC|nr:hypothetical protein CDAR_114781 [Caerostris darwini]